MKKRRLPRILAAVFLAVIPLFWIFPSLHRIGQIRTEEGRRLLENTLRQSAASHYADTGRYPATLEQLALYAGIRPDTERYAIFYDAFAENLMPDITVLVIEK